MAFGDQTRIGSKQKPDRVGYGNVRTTPPGSAEAIVHHSVQTTDEALDQLPSIEPLNPSAGALFPELD